MKKIYGNDYLLSTLESMVNCGRTAHTVLFYGEKGCGKKLIAKYYIKLLLCENKTDGKPCGVCQTCRNVDTEAHPDVWFVNKSGKLGGFSVETAGIVANDAYIKPNNQSNVKVYVFADCQNFDARPQNKLLKLVEEPPDYAYFIFTAESRSVFLPTIISRCVCFGVSVGTEEEACLALSECGYDKNDIKKAVSCFHGNIGMCTDYIFNEELRNKVDLTKSLADSIIRRDEYALNCAFYSVGKDRNDVRTTLLLLDTLVRDAAVLIKNSSAKTIGCFKEGAEKLAESITVYQAARIHKHIERAWKAIECNVSAPLVLASLCADIISDL